MCDNPASTRVVWTTTVAVDARGTISAGCFVKAIFATMRQFIGFTENEQFTLWANVVVLHGVIPKRVPLELWMDASPVRLGMFFYCRPRVPRAEEIDVLFGHLRHRKISCEISVGHDLVRYGNSYAPRPALI